MQYPLQKKDDQSQLRPLQEKLLNLFFDFFIIVMWFVLAASFYRALENGIKLSQITITALSLLFLLVYFLRKKISYRRKKLFMLGLIYLMGTTAIISYGLFSQGIFLNFLFILLAFFLGDQKTGLIAFLLAFASISCIGFLFINGTLSFIPQETEHSAFISAWLMALLAFTVLSFGVYLFWQNVFNFIIQKIERLVNHDQELKESNELLTKEIEHRKKIENKLKLQIKESQGLSEQYEQTNKQLETSNKLLQEEKKRSDAADRLKSSFLANMSHEIRTPLNAIVGFSTLLDNDTIEKDDRSNYLNIIQSSTTQLLDIISDIVNIAKIESEQYQLNITQFALSEIIEDLTDKYTREVFILKEDRLQFSISNDIALTDNVIDSDKECIRIILNKLIDNAIKFTNAGKISVHFSRPEKDLQIQIADTGIGMTREQQDEVFHTFRQIDHTGTRKYGGTGLGLSITKGLLDLLQGSISIDSALEKGTTINISIPVQTR